MTFTARLILILIGLAYLISPLDIIPDLMVPFLGWLDDGLVLWCIYYLIRTGDLPWFMFKRPRKPGPAGRENHTRTEQASKEAHQADDKADSRKNSGTERPSDHEILGVDETASWSEIQKAHKEKIKQYHPDKLSHLGEAFSTLANEKFLEIQEAYSRLKARHGKS